MLLQNRHDFTVAPILVDKCEDRLPSQEDANLRQTALALVHELTEPLTAIHNYLQAAVCLHNADTRAASATLVDVFDKSRAVTLRASELLHQLRDILQHE